MSIDADADAASTPGLENPFPGLRSYEASESSLFFGREDQIQDLLTSLRRARFVAVVGSSGCGKSSLVRAGILPILEHGFLVGPEASWRTVIVRPGSNPIANLADALLASGIEPPASAETPSLSLSLQAELRRGSRGLVELVRRVGLSEGSKVLVLVDQFEELFRFADRTRAEARAFVNLLVEAARQTEVPLYVMLTMRSEFLAECTAFAELPECINEGLYLVPRLTRDQLREAIEEPIALAGGAIENPLVNQLLNQLGDDPDQLPILQHALMRLWFVWRERGGDGPIGLDDERAIGGLKHALDRHLDELDDTLDPRRRHVAERLFRELAQVTDDARLVRRPRRLDELQDDTGQSADDLIAVIDHFRQPGRSFLTPPPGVPLTPESVVDLSHESLIRQWTRLREWIIDEDRLRRVEVWLLAEARRWDENDRHPGYLLTGVRLEEAREWAQHYGFRFRPRDEAFLAASLKARERAVRARVQGTFASLTAALLIGAVLTISYFLMRSMADRGKALDAQNKAVVAQREAQQAQVKEQTLRQEAQEKTAEVLQKAVQIDTLKEVELLGQNDLFRALVWSAEAIKDDGDRPESIHRLRFASLLRQCPRLDRILPTVSPMVMPTAVSLIQFLPEGDRLLAVSADSRLRVWNIHARSDEPEAEFDLSRADPRNWPKPVDKIDDTINKALGLSTKWTGGYEALAVACGEKAVRFVVVRERRNGDEAQKSRCWVWKAGYDDSFTLGGPITSARFSGDGKLLAAYVPGVGLKLGDPWKKESFRALPFVKTDEPTDPTVPMFGPDALLEFTPDGTGLYALLLPRPKKGSSTSSWQLHYWSLIPGATEARHCVSVSEDAVGQRVQSSTRQKCLQALPSGLLLVSNPDNHFLSRAAINAAGVLEIHTNAAFQLSRRGPRAFQSSLMRNKPTQQPSGDDTGLDSIVQFSPDGRWLALGDKEGVVSIVAAESVQTTITPPILCRGKPQALAFGPDGRRLATALDNGRILVWNLAAAVMPDQSVDRLVVPIPAQGVQPPMVLATDDRGAVQLRNLATAIRETVSLPDGFERLHWLDLARDGSRLLAADPEGHVRVFDTRTGALIRDNLREGLALGMQFLADGRVVQALHVDGQSQLITVEPDLAIPPETRLLGESVVSHDRQMVAWAPGAVKIATKSGILRFSPDGRRIATGGQESTARIWDTTSGVPLLTLNGKAPIIALAFNSDGHRLATSGLDRTVRIWDAETGTAIGSPLLHAKTVNALSFRPLSDQIVTVEDDKLSFWDAKTGALIDTKPGPDRPLSTIVFSRDGTRFATTSRGSTVQIWNATSRQLEESSLRSKSGIVNLVAFSPDGKQVASASDDGITRLWDRDSGREVATLSVTQTTLLALAFNDDGSRIVMVESNKAITRWDAKNGVSEGIEPDTTSGQAIAAAVNPDGRSVAFSLLHLRGSNGGDDVVKILPMDRIARVWNLVGNDFVGVPLAMGLKRLKAVSNNGRRLIAAAEGASSAVLFGTGSGQIVHQWPHSGTIPAAAFSPDDAWAITCDDEGTARLWNANDGSPFGKPMECGRARTSARFSDDSRLVMTTGDDEVRVWDVATCEPLAAPRAGSAGAFLGQKLLISGKSSVATWSPALPPSQASSALAVPLAQAMSGLRVNPGNLTLEPVPHHRVESVHEETDAAPWHRQQAGVCLEAGKWDAALWHLDRLPAAEAGLAGVAALRGQALLGLASQRLDPDFALCALHAFEAARLALGDASARSPLRLEIDAGLLRARLEWQGGTGDPSKTALPAANRP